MAFSEQTKLTAKRRSAFRCCICEQPFVEVHHITPSSESGGDTLDNAAPLCARCHDLYGGNPEKRCQIRQMRDHWWAVMRVRSENLTIVQDLAQVEVPTSDPLVASAPLGRGIGLYHLVLSNEDLTTAAEMLWKLVFSAQERYPRRPRLLFVDIEGHRNNDGKFDQEMWELQRHFIAGALARYLSEIDMPLIHVRNARAQRNDIPPEFRILAPGASLQNAIAETEEGDIFVADADKWVAVRKSDE